MRALRIILRWWQQGKIGQEIVRTSMMAAASDRRHLDVAQREARTLRLKVAELERGILLKSEHSLTLERELQKAQEAARGLRLRMNVLASQVI